MVSELTIKKIKTLNFHVKKVADPIETHGRLQIWPSYCDSDPTSGKGERCTASQPIESHCNSAVVSLILK